MAAIPVGGALIRKSAFLILITAVVTYAQTPASRNSKSDEDKIASALQASPKFVTTGATVLDYPTSPGGEFRVLRAGTNEWTYLSGAPGTTHDEAACFDQVFLQFLKDSMAVVRPICRVSESHVCVLANGYLTSYMRWEAGMHSMLGHTL